MTDLRPGAVIRYPYLWRWQSDRGETEGRKQRPVCVVVAVRSADGLTHLAMCAISTRPPAHGQRAMEIPEIERRRAGLSEWKDAWITVDEYNYDVVERSWYFEPDEPILGRFSKQLMMHVAAEAAPLFRTPRSRIDRSE